MSDVKTEIAVLNTKVDNIVETLKEMKDAREQEIKNIIAALQSEVKEQEVDNKDCKKTKGQRYWQAGFWAVTTLLIFVLSRLAEFIF